MSGTLKNISGLTFGRLTVIEEAGRDHKGEALWVCVCVCGATAIVRGNNLRSGKTRSCGCYQKDRVKETKTTHNMSSTRLYRVWRGMLDRCTNKKNKSFINYGARGISVCQQWRDPVVFMLWALKNGYSLGLEIDRKNNTGNYEPSNCRFITKLENLKNTSLIWSSNSSGFRGVSWLHRNKRFIASARMNGKTVYVGTSKSAKDAAIMRDRFVVENGLDLPLNFRRLFGETE